MLNLQRKQTGETRDTKFKRVPTLETLSIYLGMLQKEDSFCSPPKRGTQVSTTSDQDNG